MPQTYVVERPSTATSRTHQGSDKSYSPPPDGCGVGPPPPVMCIDSSFSATRMLPVGVGEPGRPAVAGRVLGVARSGWTRTVCAARSTITPFDAAVSLPPVVALGSGVGVGAVVAGVATV